MVSDRRDRFFSVLTLQVKEVGVFGAVHGDFLDSAVGMGAWHADHDGDDAQVAGGLALIGG